LPTPDDRAYQPGWLLKRPLEVHLRRAALPSLDVIAPVIMCCALLWWVSRGMTWSMRLAVAAVTLALIVVIVTIERAGFWAG
jgi:hypothetical protein